MKADDLGKQHPTISRKRLIFLGSLGVLLLLLLVAPLLVYFYIQTEGFKEKFSETLSNVTGESIEFTDEFVIKRFFPTLTVSVPVTRLAVNSDNQALKLARMDGLEVDLSYLALSSLGERGDIDIRVESLSTIVQAHADQSTSGDVPNEVVDRRRAFNAAFDFLTRLKTFRPSVFVDEVDIVVRGVDSSSQRHLFDGLSLVSKPGEVVLSVNWEIVDKEALSVNLTLNEIEYAPTSVTGQLTVGALVAGQSSNSHDFQASWTLGREQLNLTTLQYGSESVQLGGDLLVEASADSVKLTGDLGLQELLLPSLFATTSNRATSVAQQSEPAQFFSTKPIGYTIPRFLEAKLGLQIGLIRAGNTELIRGTSMISVEQGKLELRAKELQILGGDSELTMSLQTQKENSTAVKFKLNGDDLQLARVLNNSNGEPMIDQGSADVILAFAGSGESPSAIAASTNGYLISAVADTQINQKYSTVVDRGIVSWGLDNISALTNRSVKPLDSKLSDPLMIHCASLKVYINNGRAEVSNGGIVEFPQNTLYSSGYIDLAEENIGFVFRSKNKKLFDWSAISMIKYAELGGTLSSPVVQFNTTELFKQGVLTASSAAWGPLPSLVYSLAESGFRNRQNAVCVGQIE